MTFRDRHDAGRQLAILVRARGLTDPVVLALPRGGVPVAVEVAHALDAPLDVLVVRKLGCPWHPELGFGAVSEAGVRILNAGLVAELELTSEEVERVTARERREVQERVRRYRGGGPSIALHGRTVIVVDDGIATGSTARAAIEVARHRGATRVVLAVPVGSPDSLDELAVRADEVVCLHRPTWFGAVGRFYDDFAQVTDDEVARILAGARAAPRHGVDVRSDR